MRNITDFITDVDGVLTDGKYFYSVDGKILKQFGPHDSDGFKIIKSLGIKVRAISADHRGFNITKKRFDDMGIELILVSESERLNWIKLNCNPDNTIFVGDGLYDAAVMKICSMSFAPSNALSITKDCAKHTTIATGGNGVILEIALNILKELDNKKYKKFISGNV